MAQRRYVDQIMGLPIILALRGRHTDDDAAQQAWAGVQASLREADQTFSTYRADSFISRLSRAEITLAECPAEIDEVLAYGEQARVDSAGAFDVRRAGPDGLPVLDPSGVVKGWAVQRAATHLATLDGTDFCLNAGGDMLCHVEDPSTPAWRIGVENPHDPSRTIAVLSVRDGAVATSGTVHRGAHIVDPRSGQAPTELASVTVACTSLVDADIDATAAFVLGSDAASWLTARGRQGVIVWADGAVTTV